MAKYQAQSQLPRTGITSADTTVPAAPDDIAGIPVFPLPAGVWQTSGAKTLKIDIICPSGSTGSTTLNIYAWNRQLGQWVSEGQAVVTAAAVGDFGSRLVGRAVVTDWVSDYVAVMVKTLATGGGSGVGTTVGIICSVEDI